VAGILGFEFAEQADLDIHDIGYNKIKSAYRMGLDHPDIDHETCKKNCRNIPKCLSSLGEKVWFEEEDEEEDYELENELLRSDGIPAGLRNLGNTCYVNSFLQIWFHNSKFRQALYEWDPGEDPEEVDNESILDPDLYEPRSKVASLQALFAMMQYTKRKYADPTDFICKLGLNPSVQQDAQEFSKLFVSLLENSLEHQTNINIRSMIQKQFRGEYAYVTTCLTCKRESVRPSLFYELDLALTGSKNLTVEKCLEGFLKVEKMTGDEKYFCEGCQSKQEATRCCKLRELPPVLNLQLNRFQYDMQIGRKKKLNSCIMFPDELDMSKYLEDANKESCSYRLTGVLMHVGPDANHGHYIAHIQELETGNWFKFSDEHVESIDRKCVSDKGNKKPKGVDRGPGMQSSNNAYMLVYMLNSSIAEIRNHEMKEMTKRDTVRRTTIQKRNAQHLKETAAAANAKRSTTNVTDDSDRRGIKRKSSVDSSDSVEDYSDEYCYSNCRVFPVSFQPHLRNKIDKDNLEFDEEIEEKKQHRLEIVRIKNRKKHKMKETYRNLVWTEDENYDEDEDSYEFVPKCWLMSWLADPSSVGPLETNHLLCVHENLDIDRLGDVKHCDGLGVSMLIDEYGLGDGPRLDSERLCTQCVKNKARMISLDYKIQRDQEFLLHELKVPTDGKGFWVGKKSLTNWKRLAKVALENRIVREVQGRTNYSKDDTFTSIEDESMDSSDEEMLQEVPSSPALTVSGLKAKLERMGTNVSIASSNGTVKLKSSSADGGAENSGLSVIKNGESFRMANIAEVKLNLDDSSRPPAKPSCAVKPILKPTKPSATVRPLNMQQKSEDSDVEILETIEPRKMPTAEPRPEPNQIYNGGDVRVPVKPFQLEPTSLLNSVSRSSNLDSPVRDSKCSDSQETLKSPEKNLCRVVPSVNTVTAASNGVVADTEDSFNADIVCPHGNLRVEERCKQLVSRQVWFLLCEYFHHPKTFQFGVKPCSLCREDESRAFIKKEKWREEASRQKSKLPDLFTNMDRPKWSKPTTKCVYLVSSDFVLAWKGFVRGMTSGKIEVGESITHINNSSLLCEHGGLLHIPQFNWENEPDVDVVMVKEDEWSVIKEMFVVDHEIRVDRENTSNGPTLVSTPTACDICFKSRAEAEQESRLIYKNEILYVTYLTQDEELPNGVTMIPATIGSEMSGGYGMRRSTRRKKLRGEREFVVSSDSLLRDLKVQIMEVFKVAPYDQILFLDGEYLRDNTQNLGTLGVLPGSAIFLKADNTVPCPPEDWINPHPEQGFKGTGLLSN